MNQERKPFDLVRVELKPGDVTLASSLTKENIDDCRTYLDEVRRRYEGRISEAIDSKEPFELAAEFFQKLANEGQPIGGRFFFAKVSASPLANSYELILLRNGRRYSVLILAEACKTTADFNQAVEELVAISSLDNPPKMLTELEAEDIRSNYYSIFSHPSQWK